MRPLLVGEANPYQDDDEEGRSYAFYPEPARAAGDRLCRVVLGLSVREYLRMFDRTNLCGVEWSMGVAREYAQRILRERARDDVISACGARVARAFDAPYEPFTMRRIAADAPLLVIIPHPSGLNRAWNEPGAILRARARLRAAGVLPPHVRGGNEGP